MKNRLLSLDVFRGITMFLLVAEAARIYHTLGDALPTEGVWRIIIEQFHHHPWNGLRFWDLIQPFFMFIVGVAMPFSLQSRLSKGDEWSKVFKHILKRCAILFLLGTGLHCVYNGHLVWELWNVLTQLSFTILLAFLLMSRPIKEQIGAVIILLILTELLYRTYNPSEPFVKDANFGSWADLILMGKLNNGGGWVAINIIPTAVHTIGGVICGKILLSARKDVEKVSVLIYPAIAILLIGYGLDFFSITPIIKRIATTSFILVSGGWCLLVLAFLYWFVDIKGYKKWTFFFSVVGMNSIFIYIFSETIGAQWLGGFSKIWGHGIFGIFNLSEGFLDVISAIISLSISWFLCYFLYKKNVFIKI